MSKKILFFLLVIVVIVVCIYFNLNYVLPWWSFLIVGLVIGILYALFKKMPDKPKKGDRHDF